MRLRTAILTAILMVGSVVRAQPVAMQPAGTNVTTISATAIHQQTTGLDTGGDFGLNRLGAEIDFFRSLGEGRAVGIGLDYYTDAYSFGGDFGIGANDPWGDINNLSLSIGYSGNLGDDWQVRVAPSVTAAGESGASLGDSLVYGAVIALTHRVSETLTIGLGGGAFTGLEETRAYPFLAIRWEFARDWTLQNPFRPGPAGPAGLEIAYRTADWEFGLGGAYRSYRFRLNDDGLIPNGIGETSGIPLFVRVNRSLSSTLSLDAYAGVLVGGSIEAETSGGLSVLKTDFDPAPLFALSVSGRF